MRKRKKSVFATFRTFFFFLADRSFIHGRLPTFSVSHFGWLGIKDTRETVRQKVQQQLRIKLRFNRCAAKVKKEFISWLIRCWELFSNTRWAVREVWIPRMYSRASRRVTRKIISLVASHRNSINHRPAVTWLEKRFSTVRDRLPQLDIVIHVIGGYVGQWFLRVCFF